MSWFFANSAVDTDAQDLFDRIVTAGDTVGATARAAYNAWVTGTKADGDWDSWLDFYPFIADGLTGGLIKGKKLSTGWTGVNNGFVSGDYSLATGLTGDGSSYLDADFTCSTALTVNNTGIFVYDRSTADSTINIHGAGVNGDGNQQHYLLAPHSDNGLYSSQHADAGAVSVSPITGAVGGLHAARDPSASNNLRMHRNGVSLTPSPTIGGGALPAFKFYWFARNLSGTAGLFSSHAYSFLGVTEGVTVAQAARMYARVQALQTALGRNV